jgi:GT2 family glycosyltransferase
VADVDLIIVSYKTRELTRQCLTSLRDSLRNSRCSATVFLVDNASGDGTVEMVRSEFPEVRLIESATNLGFGKANNLAAREGTSPMMMLLNSDAFIRTPGAMDVLLAKLHGDESIAVVGPRLLNRDGTLQLSCFSFPTPLNAWLENLGVSKLLPAGSKWGGYRNWKHDDDREVDWAIGACLMIRRSAWEAVGGFDEQFFMYAEETDLQRRIRDRGQRVWFTPAVEVEHWAGASGLSNNPAVREMFFASLDHYVRKHHGLIGLMSLRAAMIVGCGVRAVGWAALSLWNARARKRCGEHVWLLWRQLTQWRVAATT